MTEEHELQVAGREVARYVIDTEDLDPTLGRRPYLHPIRTLGGTVVTATQPADHLWHLGFSVAIPNVDGTNFWGGRTYRAADGYQPRADHGAITHRRWLRREPDVVEHELDWVGHTGEVLLHEHRLITAAAGPGCWTLTLATTLCNATGRSIALGSPGSAGRVGAGYGGLFWRLPPGLPEVTGPGRHGEEELNGAVVPSLEVRTPAYTLRLESTDGDPWFVRAAQYPGVGTAFAWDQPVPLEPGAEFARHLDIHIADGETWRAPSLTTRP